MKYKCNFALLHILKYFIHRFSVQLVLFPGFPPFVYSLSSFNYFTGLTMSTPPLLPSHSVSGFPPSSSWGAPAP